VSEQRVLLRRPRSSRAYGSCCAATRWNLTRAQRGVIRDLETTNKRTFRAFQLKEELRDILALPLLHHSPVLNCWAWPSRGCGASGCSRCG
jgi:hypothetical protein